MTSDTAAGRPWISLEPAEEALLERAAVGEVFELSVSAAEQDSGSLGADSAAMIRAGVLRHLLTQTDWPVDPKGVQLRGVVSAGNWTWKRLHSAVRYG